MNWRCAANCSRRSYLKVGATILIGSALGFAVMSVGAGLDQLPDYTVQEEAMDHPWMEGTGFESGDEIVCGRSRVVVDSRRLGRPDELTNFFHYESGTYDRGSIVNDQNTDAVSYTAPSGVRVFSCGTLGYTYRLDPDPSWDISWPYNQLREYKPAVLDLDPGLQRFQRNVFDDLQQ